MGAPTQIGNFANLIQVQVESQEAAQFANAAVICDFVIAQVHMQQLGAFQAQIQVYRTNIVHLKIQFSCFAKELQIGIGYLLNIFTLQLHYMN